MGASREGWDIIILLLYLPNPPTPRTGRHRCRGAMPAAPIPSLVFFDDGVRPGHDGKGRGTDAAPLGLAVSRPARRVVRQRISPDLPLRDHVCVLARDIAMAMRARAPGNRAKSATSQGRPSLDPGVRQGAGRFGGLRGVRDIGVSRPRCPPWGRPAPLPRVPATLPTHRSSEPGLA